MRIGIIRKRVVSGHMSNFIVCLNAVLPIFLLMAVGYAAKCFGMLRREDINKINKVIFHVFLPVMMFYNIYQSDLDSAVRPRLILYAVGGVLCALALSVLLARFFVRERDRRGVVIQGIYRSNFVIIGAPIVSSLVEDADLGPVAVLLAIVVPLYNVIAVILLEYYSGEKTPLKKLLLDILKNPLVLGSIVGFLALGLHLRLPVPLETVARQMTQVVSPMLLFLLGAFFCFDGLRRYRKELLLVCTGRLIVVPGIFLSLAALLGFRGLELAALIGVFASATATTSFAMTQQIGGDAELAGDIVVSTSALCSFTMFLWCLLFKTLGMF